MGTTTVSNMTECVERHSKAIQMPFYSELDVRVLSGGDSVLLRPLDYRCHLGNVIVPAGFVTDFASIPRLLRVIVTGQDNTRKPAVIHDYLYVKKLVERSKADKIFYLALRDSGADWWKSRLIWAAVRVGGWVGY